MATSPPEIELRSGTGLRSQVSEGLSRHRGLILFAVNKYLSARPDLADDILAVARATLAGSLRDYHVEMGFTFSKYAVNQMRWRVAGFLARFTRKDASTHSLAELRGEGEDGAFTLADLADAQNAARERSAGIADENLLKRICDLREAIATCATLTCGEREILNAFLEGGNGATVAAGLGLTPQRVSQALASAAAKLRKQLQATG